MTMHRLPENPATTPGPHQPDWIEWLHWLLDEGHITTPRDVIGVVEKPAKWQNEYRTYYTERFVASQPAQPCTRCGRARATCDDHCDIVVHRPCPGCGAHIQPQVNDCPLCGTTVTEAA